MTFCEELEQVHVFEQYEEEIEASVESESLKSRRKRDQRIQKAQAQLEGEVLGKRSKVEELEKRLRELDEQIQELEQKQSFIL